MITKWYADATANMMYAVVKKELTALVGRVFPRYELSHFGINRNDFTEEIKIVLHLNQLGSIRITPAVQDDHLLAEVVKDVGK